MKSKPKTALAATEKPKPYAVTPKPQVAPALVSAKSPAERPAAKTIPAAPAGAPAAKPAATAPQEAASQLLNRAERDIASVIDSLNNQMNAALTALAELASAQAERGKAVVRTAPLDRATATFQRLVTEVVDDQLAEILPPLIALRSEMRQWAAGDANGSPEAEFHRRGVESLDHVLALAGVVSYEPRAGHPFDPLIHLAVGESHRDDLPEGAVAECLQPGFRSSRGKVLAPARVRINRR